MFDVRSPVIWSAPLVGLVLGALAWTLFSGETRVLAPVQALEASVSALDTNLQKTAGLGPDAAAQALASPLFAATALAASAPDVPVKVLGLASTPARQAALLSLNNGPAEWVAMGATKDGVTVRQVDAAKVTLETPGGTREVPLGESSTPVAGQGGAAAGAAMTTVSSPPNGYRLPPPPASAPGMRH